MRSYRVYKYTFPNGMIYIGVTSLSLADRRDCGYNHNKRLKDAIRECGWRQIRKEIIKDHLSQEDAFALEQKTISELNATDEKVGYNVSGGGKSTYAGLKHSDEYKKKMSDLYKGKKFSDKTLELMRKAHEKERKPVIGISPGGEEVRYKSLNDAAKAFETSPTTISRVCSRNGIYKNFKWQFA